MKSSRQRPEQATARKVGSEATTQPADSQLSWFGTLNEAEQGPGARPAATRAASLASKSLKWWSDRQALTSASQAPTFGRLYRAFLAARGVLSTLLLSIVGGAWVFNQGVPLPALGLTVAYALLTLGWWWLPVERSAFDRGQQTLSTRQALATIGVDLVTFAVLGAMGRGVNLHPAALLALPVLMGAVLLPRYLAVAVAAAATLVMLGNTVLNGLAQGNLTDSLTASGLTGFGLFCVALLVSELTSRLAREQHSARSHQEQARQQAQLNRLVIEEMSEGVLVVDRQGRVRSANPSARRLLSAHGKTPAPPFQLRGVPAWGPLVQTIEKAFNTPPRPHDTHDLQLRFDDQTRRGLQLRLKFTRGRTGQQLDDLCVLFIEDMRVVQSRARQDKLAAMGRMTAGIAHEVRNPLAAIAQANALLAEDNQTPTQARLTQMVADNVDRLKRIVDDILTVAPGHRPDAPRIDIERMLRTLVEEWQTLHPADDGAQSLQAHYLGLPPRELGVVAQVQFEPEHLRRVMVNLLDNALRHCSAKPGAIEIHVRQLLDIDQPGQVMVSVFSDGPAIDPETERSLFEPFFSTRSRGTGLGLYISRELCERHGAAIEYRQHPVTQRHRNEFYILMPLCPPTDHAS